jgi:hypothetical protein
VHLAHDWHAPATLRSQGFFTFEQIPVAFVPVLSLVESPTVENGGLSSVLSMNLLGIRPSVEVSALLY